MTKLVDVSEVQSVYSGKVHTCCCGCAGKHTYHSIFQKEAGESRGYTVSDDEVNDRSVKIITGKINKALAAGTADDQREQYGYVSVENETRLLVVYLNGRR